MRSQGYKKEFLLWDLQNIVICQPLAFKILLILLITLLCFLASVFVGSLGGLTTLHITVGKETPLEFLVMASVVVTLIVTAIHHDFIKSLLKAISVFFLAVLFIVFIKFIGQIQNISLSTFLARSWLVPTLGSGITIISFLAFRFSLAITDILFKKTKIFKIVYIFTIVLGAIAGTFIFVSIEISLETKTEFSEILSKSVYWYTVVIISGTIYSLFLTLSAYLANRYRGTPWQHPSLLRNWALTVGSWGGTSFYNLDLSNINFTSANVANTDLRAKKLYRTCFQGVTGLERARVDSRYLDLEIPKVQKLLTHGCSEDPDLSNLSLRGAYLEDADLRRIKFIDTDLTGVDLRGADLRGSILANAQVIDVDFTNANLTGICIQNWNVNSQTCFTDVKCDYIYRKLDDKGEPSDRHPADRNFEPREFESLYQEVGNVVELVFQEGVNWRAFAFTLQKLELEDEGLGLELKGIEKKGDLWVVKVTHNENVPTQEVEKRLNDSYEQLQQLLATKEQQINRLLGIAENQAEAIKEFSKRPFGNSFFISGSTITNLAGSGQIEYNEAADQVRSIVANSSQPAQVKTTVRNFLTQLQGHNVATTAGTQAELIKQVLLSEAEKDPVFKQLLVLQGRQFTDAMPEAPITTAMRKAIAQLD